MFHNSAKHLHNSNKDTLGTNVRKAGSHRGRTETGAWIWASPCGPGNPMKCVNKGLIRISGKGFPSSLRMNWRGKVSSGSPGGLPWQCEGRWRGGDRL